MGTHTKFKPQKQNKVNGCLIAYYKLQVLHLVCSKYLAILSAIRVKLPLLYRYSAVHFNSYFGYIGMDRVLSESCYK